MNFVLKAVRVLHHNFHKGSHSSVKPILSQFALVVVNQFSNTSSQSSGATKEAIGKMIKTDNVVVFMKGTPDAPKCGFSNAVVQILRMHGVSYNAYNVLEDEELRQGIKDYSNWPTIPQVYLKQEFLGGCDIMLQMHQNGELVDELKKAGIKSALLEKAVEDNTKTK